MGPIMNSGCNFSSLRQRCRAPQLSLRPAYPRSAGDVQESDHFDARLNLHVAHLGCGAFNYGTRAMSDREDWSVQRMRETQDCHDVSVFELSPYIKGNNCAICAVRCAI